MHVMPRRVLSLLSALLCIAPSSFAGPEGGRVVGGEGEINRDGNTTTITQDTDLMAIDWDTYNVGVNESVQLFQPK